MKALALGADAVLVGRATLYGLAVDGEAGASAVLGILRTEIERALTLLGCPKCARSTAATSSGSLPTDHRRAKAARRRPSKVSM